MLLYCGDLNKASNLPHPLHQDDTGQPVVKIPLILDLSAPEAGVRPTGLYGSVLSEEILPVRTACLVVALGEEMLPVRTA